ncbi:MAG: DUF4058 family protein [Chloroflexota bacterium]
MPSPFPGMDPYLEERSIWPDLHQRLITYISEMLQPQVRPKYIARIGERIELASVDKGYIPDVMIVEPPNNLARSIEPGGVLVADEPITLAFLEEERRIPYIEIIYRESGDVVTVIEVISPSNKSGEGREEYIKKQKDLLSSQVNLVEMDLLGYGRPTTLARTADIKIPADWRYVVTVSRSHRRKSLEAYAFSVKERFPRCRIPLRQADPDVVLDLPAVFTRCYEVGGYDLLVDYTRNPTTTLGDEENKWLDAYLQDLGIRS